MIFNGNILRNGIFRKAAGLLQVFILAVYIINDVLAFAPAAFNPGAGLNMEMAGNAAMKDAVQLNWDAVDGASGYQVYRQGEPYAKVGNVLEYIDTPSTEGTWYYRIASIRTKDGEESLSVLTAPKSAVSDSTASAAPHDLKLGLTPIGIKVEWIPGPFTETVTYNLYRANTPEITSVAGLTPLVKGIAQTELIDPTPSSTDKCYAVTAVDACGNESLPSNSAYLNTSLLPVNSIHIVQDGISMPIVSWTHPSASTMAGYNLFIGPKDNMTKVNGTTPLPVLSYTDTGYNGTERYYGLTALDANGFESLKRTICLPQISVTLLNSDQQSAVSDQLSVILAQAGIQSDPSVILNEVKNLSLPRRGLMNRLNYLVSYPSSDVAAGFSLRSVRLNIKLDKYSHVSEPFSINPQRFSGNTWRI